MHSQDRKICYIPSNEYLISHNFGYEQRVPTNLEPNSIESLIIRGQVEKEKVHKINYKNIAKAADLSE